MPTNLGQAFRQFGEDVRGAIVDPVRARLEAAQYKRALEDDELKREDQNLARGDRDLARERDVETEEARQRYADSLHKRGEHEKADAFLATGNLPRVPKPRKLSTQERYSETLNFLGSVDQHMTKLQGGLAEKVMAAGKSGGKAGALDQMQQFGAIQDAIRNKVNPEIASLGRIVSTEGSMGAKIADGVSKALTAYKPKEVEFIVRAVFETLPKKLQMSQSAIDDIRAASAKYNLGDPFEGIPSIAETQGALLQAALDRDITKGQLEDLMGNKHGSFEDYEKRLHAIVKGVDDSGEFKALANMFLLNIEASNVLNMATPRRQVSGGEKTGDPRLKKLASRLTREELAEMDQPDDARNLRNWSARETKRRGDYLQQNPEHRKNYFQTKIPKTGAR